jgi:cell division protein FtsL
MNVAVRTWNQTTVESTMPMSWVGWVKYQRRMWLLAFLVVLSAFSVIFVRGVNRQLTADWQALQVSSQKLSIEKDRLLLERSVWMDRAHVARVAKKNGMYVPKYPKLVEVPTL